MKLVFKKLVFGDAGFKILPRVEFDPSTNEADSFKENKFNLSRAGLNPSCVFTLENFAAHDSHAPGWLSDESAPPDSSAPTVTAQMYMDRIVAAIKETGAQVADVQVVEEQVAPYFPDDDGPADETDDPSKPKYGLN